MHLIQKVIPICLIAIISLSPACLKADAKKANLLNSDGSTFTPKDYYPKFSWDSTPRYFMFGNKARVLKPDQVRFISEQTEFICIEKSHAPTLGHIPAIIKSSPKKPSPVTQSSSHTSSLITKLENSQTGMELFATMF